MRGILESFGLAITIGTLGGCNTCPSIWSANLTDYDHDPNATTPNGIEVDTSGQEVALDDVDCIVHALEACLNAKADQGLIVGAFTGHIGHDCLRIKIAPDWFVNENGKQRFPCGHGDHSCAGVVQYGWIAVTTPNLATLSHEISHVFTELNDPFPEELRDCTDRIRADNCAEAYDTYAVSTMEQAEAAAADSSTEEIISEQ